VHHHLFEVKYYDRPIDLAVAAKSMLVALLRKPQSLSIVSSTRLAPQVCDYVHHFFHVPDGDLRGSATSEQRPLSDIDFYHILTSTLLEPELISRVDVPRRGDGVKPDFTWTLSEIGPHADQKIRDSDDPQREITLLVGRAYRLSFVATLPHASFGKSADDAFSVSFDDETLSAFDIVGDARVDADPTRRTLTGSLVLRPSCSGSSVVHAVLKKKSKPLMRTSLMAANVIDDPHCLTDFNPQAFDRFARVLADEDHGVIVLTGEAGTGKTMLCDRYAAWCRSSGNRRPSRFNVNDGESETLMRVIAMEMLMPQGHEISTVHDIRSLLTELVRAMVEPEVDGGRRFTPIEACELAANAAVQFGPRFIHVADCERLDKAGAKALAQFVYGIDRRGWMGTHVVLEGRPSRADSAWAWLQSALQKLVRRTITLKPMTQEQMFQALHRRFEHVSSEQVALLWNFAGGNPLHVASALDLLREGRAVETRSDGRLRITASSRFEEALQSGMIAGSSDAEGLSDRSESIIRDRLLAAIRTVETGLPFPFDDAPMTLGLFALAETPKRTSLLRQLLPIGNALPGFMACLQTHELVAEGADGAIPFGHDMYRLAAINLARRVDSSRVDALLESVSSGSGLDHEGLELLGDIKSFFGESDKARTEYARAGALAERADRYADVIRISGKHLRLLDRPTRMDPAKERVACLERRAWGNWNAGSMTEARSEFRAAYELLHRGTSPTFAEREQRMMAASVARRLVGIDLELNDLESAVASATDALAEEGELRDFNSVANRVVLLSARYNLPDVAARWLPIAARYLDHPDDARTEIEGRSVLCSDAGRLWLPTVPEKALAMFQRGFELAVGPRQVAWGRIDLLLAEFARGSHLDEDDLASIQDDVVARRLSAFYVRLDLLRFARSLAAGNLREARINQDAAKARLQIYEQRAYALGWSVNALVFAILESDEGKSRERYADLVQEFEVASRGRQAARARLLGPVLDRAMRLTRRFDSGASVQPFRVDHSAEFPEICGNLCAAAVLAIRVATYFGVEAPASITGFVREIGADILQARYDSLAKRHDVDSSLGTLALCLE